MCKIVYLIWKYQIYNTNTARYYVTALNFLILVLISFTIKGGTTKCENYRGINLLDLTYNIMVKTDLTAS